MGAKVIAAASSEEKVKVCLEHGADETIVYSDSLSDEQLKNSFQIKSKNLLMGKEPMLYMILLAVITVSRQFEQPHGKVDIWLLDLLLEKYHNHSKLGTFEGLPNCWGILGCLGHYLSRSK